MSEEEAEARRAARATGACIALTAVGAILGAAVWLGFFSVAVIGIFGGWASGFWCAKAKGYPAYFGLLGPLFCLGLPSLHPAYERVRRWEAAQRAEPKRDDAPS